MTTEETSKISVRADNTIHIFLSVSELNFKFVRKQWLHYNFLKTQ